MKKLWKVYKVQSSRNLVLAWRIHATVFRMMTGFYWYNFYSPCVLIPDPNPNPYPNPDPNQHHESHPNPNWIPNPNLTMKWSRPQVTWPSKSSFWPITPQGCIFTQCHVGWFVQSALKTTSEQILKGQKYSNLKILWQVNNRGTYGENMYFSASRVMACTLLWHDSMIFRKPISTLKSSFGPSSHVLFTCAFQIWFLINQKIIV